MGDGAVEEAVRAAVSAARGHFRYESGHHGDLWLDLDGLLVDARRVRDWATELARRAAFVLQTLPVKPRVRLPIRR